MACVRGVEIDRRECEELYGEFRVLTGPSERPIVFALRRVCGYNTNVCENGFRIWHCKVYKTIEI